MQEVPDPQINTKEHPDLYRKSIKGGYWVILLRLTINVLGFIKTLVVANFFFLENLGIISIAMMMMEVLTTFTQTGFDSALIQKKEDIRSYLNTAWVANVIKGVVLFLILYYAAPLLASIRVPEDKITLAASILRAMSLCFLIRGLHNIGTIYFQKELDFRKVFTLSLVASLTNITLTLSLVFIFRSIWGVIVAQILAEAVHCLGGYILSPYRPRFRFELPKARELWRFGKWIYGGNILGYLISQGDDYFVWFYLGLPQLALYRYAFRFATMPATHITQVISTVSFPAYSKIQNDIPRLRQAYLKVLTITALFSVPNAFLIFSLGPDFVRLFLPERMHPMIFTLQLLALKGFMASFSATTNPLYQSLGKPYITWTLTACFLPMLAILIYPLTKMWGITGTALATIIPGFVILPTNIIILCRVLNCSVLTIIRSLLFPAFASAGMAGFLLLLKMLVFTHLDYVSFGVLGIIGIGFYGIGVWLLDDVSKQGVRELVVEQVYLVKKRLCQTIEKS